MTDGRWQMADGKWQYMNRLPTEHTYIEERVGECQVTLTGKSGKPVVLQCDRVRTTTWVIEDAHAPKVFDPVTVHCGMKPVE
jgi:hypothetical protein